MKFLLSTAAIIGLSCTQFVNEQLMESPIVIYEDQMPDVQDKSDEIQMIQSEKPLRGAQEFNPFQFIPVQQILEENKIQLQNVKEQVKPLPQPTPMPFQKQEKLRDESFHDHSPSGPMPGQQQFNPIKIDQEYQTTNQNVEKNQKKKHKKNKQKHLKKYEQQNFEYEQNNHQRNYKKNKHHKGGFPLIFVAIFFTFIGVIVGKCVMKALKCKKHQKKRMMQANRSSDVVRSQIQQVQSNLNKLRCQFQQKRRLELSAHQIRNEYNEQAHQMRMIQMIQPQQHMNRIN